MTDLKRAAKSRQGRDGMSRVCAGSPLRHCRICGGPLRSDNRTGFCRRNLECKRQALLQFRRLEQGLGYRGPRVLPIALDRGAVVLEMRLVDGVWYRGDVRRNCGCELVAIREQGRCTAISVYPSPAKYNLTTTAQRKIVEVRCSKCGRKWGVLSEVAGSQEPAASLATDYQLPATIGGAA
jgi:hypothetical protein